MDSMVRTTMAIEKERRASLLLVQERSRRLLVHDGFRDRAAGIRAKAILGLLAS